MYCKRGTKEATQRVTAKNNSPPYKRTQDTRKAQKTLSLNETFDIYTCYILCEKSGYDILYWDALL